MLVVKKHNSSYLFDNNYKSKYIPKKNENKANYAFLSQEKPQRYVNANVKWEIALNYIINFLQEKESNFNEFDGYLIDNWEDRLDEIKLKIPISLNYILKPNDKIALCDKEIYINKLKFEEEKKESIKYGYISEKEPTNYVLGGYQWKFIKYLIYKKNIKKINLEQQFYLNNLNKNNKKINLKDYFLGYLIPENKWDDRKNIIETQEPIQLHKVINKSDNCVICLKRVEISNQEKKFIEENSFNVLDEDEFNNTIRYSDKLTEFEKIDWICNINQVYAPDEILKFEPNNTIDTLNITRPPPPHYICKKCGFTGHFVNDCKKNRTTGIPQTMFKKPETEEEKKNSILDNYGKYVVLKNKYL